jgi:hypothetical protein
MLRNVNARGCEHGGIEDEENGADDELELLCIYNTVDM